MPTEAETDDVLSRLSGLSNIAKDVPREITQFEMDQAVWSVLNRNQEIIVWTKENEPTEEEFIKKLPFLLRDREYKWEGVAITPKQDGFELVRGALTATVPFAKVLHEYIEPVDVSTMKCPECEKPLFHREGGKLKAHEHVARDRHSAAEVIEGGEGDEDTMGENEVGDILDEGEEFVSPENVPEYVPPIASFKMNDWSPMKVLLSAAMLVVEETTLQVQPEGIRFSAMDPSHVCLPDIFLPAEAFTGYSVEKGFNLSLRTEDYKEKLKLMSAREPFDAFFGPDPDRDNEVFLKIRNGKDTYRIHPIESGWGKPPVPKLDLTARWVTTKEFLEEVLKKAKDSGDQVTFEAYPDRLRFFARSDVGEFEREWSKNDMELLSYEVNPPPHEEGRSDVNKSTFSLDYLLPQVKVIPKGTVVTMEFGRRMPVKMSYKFDEYQRCEFTYWLACRVSD